MPRPFLLVTLTLFVGIAFADDASHKTPKSPLSEQRRTELSESFTQSLEESSAFLKEHPESLKGYSQRGDALFFLGRFKEAVADYDKLNELDEKQASANWRRGIALFYAERYEDAAAQFESYHSFDQVDRENGIWRYLSQYKAFGREKAREGLLKYKKDDREPFPAVYQLFAGAITPREILDGIAKAEISRQEREMRLFYAQLYIGLNYAVEGESDKARENLAAATVNSWGPVAGYGPTYMWHVGRLHEELLRKQPVK